MFDGDLELTIEEEEKIQNPANIYSLIRTLQFIEWAYNFSHIDRESYTKETNIILEQYKNATNAFTEYEGLDNFVKHYKLEDCTYAINRIKEGNKERIQEFRGDVIAIKGSGDKKRFTVRKMSGNVGVERIFPMDSPFIEKITVNKYGKVRRSKLYYLRDLTGKKARIPERRVK